MIRRKKNNIFLLLLLICLQGFSQQFQYTASLSPVASDSFYSIPVTPELSSYLKTDLSDIRIADEKGQWIPHVVNWSLKNRIIHTVLTELPILAKENNAIATTLIVDNRPVENLSNLLLFVKNSAARRFAVVSGGDDKKNWFTITDSILLSSPETILENRSAFKIKLPIVNYQYFKITIYNSGKDPFNVQSISSEVAGDSRFKEQYVTNPPVQFVQTDSIGYSLIKITNTNSYHFDLFGVDVSSPKFYDRRVKMYLSNPDESIRSLLSSVPEQEYIFSSGNTNKYETRRLKASTFYLLIDNRDNPPLKIAAVNTMQVNKDLIAYLEKGHQYRLLFDDSTGIAPDYDLQKFRDRIPANLSVLSSGKISIADKATQFTKTKDNKKEWLWPAIILILLLLGFFTWKLNKDIKKGNNTE